jgi:uncharacterized repeat protein (TIGR01451 family)
MFRAIFTSFCLTAGGLFSSLTAAAWDCDSAHRNQITITAGAAGHSEEIRVDLSSADLPADYIFTPAGDDVRVVLASDDTTLVDHIVTAWNGVTRTGTIYIKLPTLAANTSTSVYIYYGDGGLVGLSDIDAVFPVPGLRLRSRVSNVDPTDASSALLAFANATVDVYDAVRTSVSGLNNRALGGTNGNYGWCISAMIEVTPANVGTWEFRYGADFGHGGHLYVRGVELEEQWNDDLWWANNFNNTAETLEGSIALDAGWHRYEALGFEGCCDGSVGWQARAPGGPWQDMSSANFSMRATRCVVTTVTVSVGAASSCSKQPDASKSMTVISDPFANPSPFALPGSVVEYSLNVVNTGQKLDEDTVILTDQLPPEIKLIVNPPTAFTFTEGATATGLNMSWVDVTNTGDGVSFSTDGSVFTYTPMPDGTGADAAITHVRFAMTGEMTARMDGIPDPEFTITYRAIIK